MENKPRERERRKERRKEERGVSTKEGIFLKSMNDIPCVMTFLV